MGAQRALSNLDIDPHDYSKLAQILDHEHRGAVDALDILNGLQRLRGITRRSDTISLALVVDGMQEKIEHITGLLASWQHAIIPPFGSITQMRTLELDDGEGGEGRHVNRPEAIAVDALGAK